MEPVFSLQLLELSIPLRYMSSVTMGRISPLPRVNLSSRGSLRHTSLIIPGGQKVGFWLAPFDDFLEEPA